MTKQEFIDLFESENGFKPDSSTVQMFLDHYNQIEDDEDNTQPRQQGRVYQFTRSTSASTVGNGADDLLKEIKDIFRSAHRKTPNSKDDYVEEFWFMAIAFLLKTSLYFWLKRGSSKGIDFTNL